MKNIIAVLLLGLALAAPASAGITGTTVEGTPACAAEELNTDSKALLNLWIELNHKLQAQTLTQDEYDMGSMLTMTGTCGLILGDLSVNVAQLDGVDYLIQVPSLDNVTLIIKSDGIIEAD